MEINKAPQWQVDVERLLHQQLEVLYHFIAKLYFEFAYDGYRQ
jgi:hypothetical protein